MQIIDFFVALAVLWLLVFEFMKEGHEEPSSRSELPQNSDSVARSVYEDAPDAVFPEPNKEYVGGYNAGDEMGPLSDSNSENEGPRFSLRNSKRYRNDENGSEGDDEGCPSAKKCLLSPRVSSKISRRSKNISHRPVQRRPSPESPEVPLLFASAWQPPNYSDATVQLLRGFPTLSNDTTNLSSEENSANIVSNFPDVESASPGNSIMCSPPNVQNAAPSNTSSKSDEIIQEPAETSTLPSQIVPMSPIDSRTTPSMPTESASETVSAHSSDLATGADPGPSNQLKRSRDDDEVLLHPRVKQLRKSESHVQKLPTRSKPRVQKPNQKSKKSSQILRGSRFQPKDLHPKSIESATSSLKRSRSSMDDDDDDEDKENRDPASHKRIQIHENDSRLQSMASPQITTGVVISNPVEIRHIATSSRSTSGSVSTTLSRHFGTQASSQSRGP